MVNDESQQTETAANCLNFLLRNLCTRFAHHEDVNQGAEKSVRQLMESKEFATESLLHGVLKVLF